MPTPAPYTYPFDGSGESPANHVTGEVQSVTAVNSNEYHIVVPNFAPFFRPTGGVLFTVINGTTMTPMSEGIDYLFTHKFVEATINTAKPVYGSITLLDKNFSGLLILDYQTVGGEWTLNEDKINEILANNLLNPRITTWEQLGDVPCNFPVIDHMHVDPEELIGMPELVAAVEAIGLALAGMELTIDYSAIYAYVDSKIQDSLNPDTSIKAPSVRAVNEALTQLQLGVHIGPIAPPNPQPKQLWWNNNNGRMFIYYDDGDTIQWVETSPGSAGSNIVVSGETPPDDPFTDQLWWKPSTSEMSIYDGSSWLLVNDPGGVTVPDANTTTKGIIQIATYGEVNAGATVSKAITPDALSQYSFNYLAPRRKYCIIREERPQGTDCYNYVNKCLKRQLNNIIYKQNTLDIVLSTDPTQAGEFIFNQEGWYKIFATVPYAYTASNSDKHRSFLYNSGHSDLAQSILLIGTSCDSGDSLLTTSIISGVIYAHAGMRAAILGVADGNGKGGIASNLSFTPSNIAQAFGTVSVSAVEVYTTIEIEKIL